MSEEHKDPTGSEPQLGAEAYIEQLKALRSSTVSKELFEKSEQERIALAKALVEGTYDGDKSNEEPEVITAETVKAKETVLHETWKNNGAMSQYEQVKSMVELDDMYEDLGMMSYTDDATKMNNGRMNPDYKAYFKTCLEQYESLPIKKPSSFQEIMNNGINYDKLPDKLNYVDVKSINKEK